MRFECGIYVTPLGQNRSMATKSTPESLQADTTGRIVVHRVAAPTPAHLPRRRLLQPPAVRAPQTEIFVSVAAESGCVAWVIAMVRPQQMPITIGGYSTDTSTEGVQRVLTRIQELNIVGPIALATPRADLAILAADIPQVEVYQLSAADPHPLSLAAHLELGTQLRAAEAAAPRLAVAADGSWSRCKHTAGWGVLGSNGRFAHGSTTKVSSPDAPELRAIREALRLFPGPRRLRILTDSRHAIRFIRSPGAAPALLRSQANEIAEPLRGRDISIVWTKAHCGPGLHDGADRLARLARRALDARLPGSSTRPITKRIVTESISAWHLSDDCTDHDLAA